MARMAAVFFSFLFSVKLSLIIHGNVPWLIECGILMKYFRAKDDPYQNWQEIQPTHLKWNKNNGKRQLLKAATPIVQYEFMRCYPAASVHINLSLSIALTICAEYLLWCSVEPHHTDTTRYRLLYAKWKRWEEYMRTSFINKLNQWLKR